jgi:DNA-binding transcriptional LysR family regulator
MKLASAQLDAFFEVAQTLNFTKAALNLHVTQSALSQRILNLEKELELTLFIRDRAGLRLTESAEALVRYCQIVRSLEQEMLASIKAPTTSEVAGEVRIGGFSSVMASIVVPGRAELYRQLTKIKIQSSTQELADLLERLKRGEIDYIILDDRLEREELERVFLGKEKNVLVRHKKSKSSDIYLDHDEKDETTLKYLKLAKVKTKDIKRLYLDDIHGLIEGVRSGLGQAVLPMHLIADHKEFEVMDPQQVLEIPVYLYYYSQPYYSKLHEAVVKCLTKVFKSCL